MSSSSLECSSDAYWVTSKKFYIYDIPIKKVVHVHYGDVMEFAKDKTCIVIPCVVKADGTRGSKGELFECLKKEGGETCLEELNSAPIYEKTGCILTRGGNLKVTIIHPTRAVRNARNREENIFLNILGSLKMAAKMEQKKIAFPFVFSGVAGISLESCAYQYARALTEFSRSEDVSSVLKDVYLVEKDDTKVKQLSEYFDHLLPTQKSQVLQIPHTLQETDDTIYRRNTRLKVTHEDIRYSSVHAVVCPEYEGSKYGGVFALTIKYAYHKAVEIASLKKVITKRHIAVSKCFEYEEYKPVKFLFHVRSPVWKDVPDSSGQLDACVASIFCKLKEFEEGNNAIKSVAIPLLGVVDVLNERMVRECCKAFATSVARCCRGRDGPNPLDVYLVNNCQTITAWIKEDIKLFLDF
ncbi:uncharacterized protein LOC128212520 [Mya arenaria]|uniref:uncharacterized protein LOC128212520 n=1 Tax=Mya arenaria TaxID=6604 RepID=UPI0022E21025|nr:uncharacterized protein LOC128212520 [Mya arenaria]